MEQKLNKFTRREFLKWTGISAGAVAVVGCVSQAPTTQAPAASGDEAEAPKPDELVLVYWTVDGDEEAVLEISDQFEADSGIPIRWERTPNIEELMQKVLTMQVAAEQADVFPMHYFNIAKWTKEGIVQPVTGMPGLDDYLDQMSAGARAMATYEGEVWGFPYQLTLLSQYYNTVLWEQTGMAELPTTWEELGEMSKKIKADGVAQYPIVFQAGVGSEHIGETWYHLVTSIGGKVFDEEFNPLLEEGSEARQMLQWWRDTIQEWEIADPRSLELRWIPAAKAMGTGEYVFCNTQPRFMRFANLPAESPTAGQHKLFACGTPMSHGLLWAMGADAGSKEHAWEMLKYFGAQTMAGDWLFPIERAKLSYATGWPGKAADDPAVNELWSEVWDIDEYKRQFAEASFVAETVPAMRTLWYLQWVEQILVPNLQDCLGGKITAGEAAGNIAQGAEDLKAQEG